MGAIASQITSLTIVYSTVYSDADQRKHQSSASLAFVRGIHRMTSSWADAVMTKFRSGICHRPARRIPIYRFSLTSLLLGRSVMYTNWMVINIKLIRRKILRSVYQWMTSFDQNDMWWNTHFIMIRRKSNHTAFSWFQLFSSLCHHDHKNLHFTHRPNNHFSIEIKRQSCIL